MAITYTIIFDVLPAEHDRFLVLLNGVLDAMRAEPMFHQAVLDRDPSTPYRYMLYETWESHQDLLDVQLQRPYRVAWHDALPTLLTRDRDIAMWEPVRQDGWG